jgi:hypothetical protein
MGKTALGEMALLAFSQEGRLRHIHSRNMKAPVISRGLKLGTERCPPNTSIIVRP